VIKVVLVFACVAVMIVPVPMIVAMSVCMSAAFKK
jgi:hypothetical protein